MKELASRGELWVLTKTRYRDELLGGEGAGAAVVDVVHAEGEGKRRVELLRLRIARDSGGK